MAFSHEHEHIDEQMVKLEVNLDDMSPEWLGFLLDTLFESGANDAFYIPIYMKKNRPGIMLQVLCSADKLDSLKEIIFKETTTLGIRYTPMHVHRLERRFSKVDTRWGTVTIKEGLHQGKVVQTAPEYEDCKQIAQREKVPLKQIYHAVWKEIQD